eukprot:g15883.t1
MPRCLRPFRRCSAVMAGTSRAFSFWAPQATVLPKRLQSPLPGRAAVAVLLDGTSQEYIDEAVKRGCMPFWQTSLLRARQRATWGLAAGVMPASTLGNVAGVLTGVTPDQHGVVDTCSHTGGQQLQAETLLAKLAPEVRSYLISAHAGVIDLLAGGTTTLISLAQSAPNTHRAPTTLRDPQSCAEPACLEALRLATRLLSNNHQDVASRAALLLVHVGDHVQHGHAPGTAAANSFYQAVDRELDALDRLGAVLAVSSSHGMSSKVGFSGGAKVVYVGDELAKAAVDCRVEVHVDRQVQHEGEVGGMASVYVAASDVDKSLSLLRSINGLYAVMNRTDAARAFDLPSSKIGDIVVVGDQTTAVGTFHSSAARVADGLRTHGSLQEQTVPVWFNSPLKQEYKKRLTTGRCRNFHLLDLLLNGTDPNAYSSAAFF